MFKKGDTAANANTSGHDSLRKGIHDAGNQRKLKAQSPQEMKGDKIQDAGRRVLAKPRDFSSNFNSREDKTDWQRCKQERRCDGWCMQNFFPDCFYYFFH